MRLIRGCPEPFSPYPEPVWAGRHARGPTCRGGQACGLGRGMADDGVCQDAAVDRRGCAGPLGGTVRPGRRGVRQTVFGEYTIEHEEHSERHFDDVHYNPVKHGYVRCPRDWPWSSFHRWVRGGVYPEDWACSGNEPCGVNGTGDAVAQWFPIGQAAAGRTRHGEPIHALRGGVPQRRTVWRRAEADRPGLRHTAPMGSLSVGCPHGTIR